MSIALTRRASMLGLGSVALAPTTAFAQQGRRASAHEQDRAAILAMAGDYRVRFNFRETVAFTEDYAPLEPKVSGGHESVRVIADEGAFISLQHLLVVDAGDGPSVIKHWRQDWTYEPRALLVYERMNTWSLADVGRSERTGAWAQTVWQTDDSPRYGGVGRWSHDHGRSVWTSGVTLRPLARRDAIRNPPYNRYASINRHALTPTGWVHEQDNEKLGERGGGTITFVHEDGYNTYDPFADFAVSAAEAYWASTRDYWGHVRSAWESAIRSGRGVSVEQEADNGSVTGAALMELADRLHAGAIAAPVAVAEAQAIIVRATASART